MIRPLTNTHMRAHRIMNYEIRAPSLQFFLHSCHYVILISISTRAVKISQKVFGRSTLIIIYDAKSYTT